MKKFLKKGFLALALIFTLIGVTTLKNSKISAFEYSEEEELFSVFILDYNTIDYVPGSDILISNKITNYYSLNKDFQLYIESEVLLPTDYNIRFLDIDNEVLGFATINDDYVTIPSNVYSYQFIFRNTGQFDIVEFVDVYTEFIVYNYTLMQSFEQFIKNENQSSFDKGFNEGYNEGLQDAPPLDYPEPITDNIVSDYLLLLDELIVEPIYLYLLEFDIDISTINFSPGFGSVTWFNISLINIIRIIFGLLGIYLIVRIFYKLIKRFFSLILGGFTL